MKITCKQQDLKQGLSIVSHAVASRSPLPILTNILLTTDQGRLKISATNLEISITCFVDAEILEDGAITVPARPFTELVNSLAQGQIDLNVPSDTNTVKIKSHGSNANIKGMDATEFPVIPSVEGDETPIVLKTALLKEMIAQIVIAAADDDSRPIFTGVLVEVTDGEITFAAADSFRMALRTVSLPDYNETHSPILIPAKTLSELARILPSERNEVTMSVTQNRSQVLFHTEQMDLVSRLIEGKFPNVHAAIPAQHTTRAVVETKEFAAAVKRVAPFARDSGNTMRVRINTEDGIILESNAEDVGNNTVTVNATVDGPELQIIFNLRYLAEVLAVLNTPEVALEVNTPRHPGIIRPVSTSVDYTYVIMPMSSNR